MNNEKILIERNVWISFYGLCVNSGKSKLHQLLKDDVKQCMEKERNWVRAYLMACCSPQNMLLQMFTHRIMFTHQLEEQTVHQFMMGAGEQLACTGYKICIYTCCKWREMFTYRTTTHLHDMYSTWHKCDI